MPKKNPLPVFIQEEEGKTTIFMSGKHTLKTSKDIIFAGIRQEDVFLGCPSSFVSQGPPETPQIEDFSQDIFEPNIFSKYRDIKKRNEKLKATTYK